MEVLKTVNLTKIYGYGENEVLALNKANIEVKQGEFVAILGTSGSGKVLFKFSRRIRYTHKRRNFYKRERYFKTKKEEQTIFRRRYIGFVFQNYSLMPVLNVYDNVVLPISFDKGQGINHEYIKSLLTELGLWDKRKKYPYELSGGQQQRVAIARALANKPAIILADEPTGNLDSKTTSEVIGVLKSSSHKYNQTIIMVTHNEVLAQACDRILRIEDGILRKVGEQDV